MNTKVEGYWVYAHITPEKDVYIGMSQQQPYQRWQPSHYKETALQTYIERFGWDNIERRVLIDGLTKSQAEKIEDWFIIKATADGFCINKQRSGGHWRDKDEVYREQKKESNKVYRESNREEILEQKKAWYEANREELLEQQKVYYETHKEQRLEYQKAWYEAHREERKAYRETHKEEKKNYDKARHKQIRSTPEGKIYNRVASYNKLHPDRKIITPAEAKEMYELTGYIPDFIKHDDLI